MKVLIAYVPSLHEGYIKFFKEHKDASLFILSGDVVKELPRMERDIRALSAEDVVKAVRALGIFEDVRMISSKDLEPFSSKDEIIMPDEDVSHYVADKYLVDKEVVFSPTFLRWDKLASVKKYNVSPDTEISTKEFDKMVMKEAFAEAAKSMDWWRQIGVIAFKDGKEVARAHNRHVPVETNPNEMGDPRSNFDAGERIDLSTAMHGEASLIATAAKKGDSLEDADIYVTTFPCPNCAKLIAASGIKRVYYSDGYSLLDAESILKDSGVEFVKVEKENTHE